MYIYIYIHIYMTVFLNFFLIPWVYCPAVYRWGGVFCIFWGGLARLHLNRLCQCTGPRAILWVDESAKL